LTKYIDILTHNNNTKQQALVSDIRKVKRAGKENKIWNKNAEISYEQLIYSINYEQSPNTARDLTAPL
jgi:hypothetical protein